MVRVEILCEDFLLVDGGDGVVKAEPKGKIEYVIVRDAQSNTLIAKAPLWIKPEGDEAVSGYRE